MTRPWKFLSITLAGMGLLMLVQDTVGQVEVYRSDPYYRHRSDSRRYRSVRERGMSPLNYDKVQEKNIKNQGEAMSRKIMLDEYKDVLPAGYTSVGLANLTPEAKAVLDKKKADLDAQRAAEGDSFKDPVAPEALDVLRKMSDHIGGLKTFRMSLQEYRQEIQNAPAPVEVRSKQTFIVQRPNRLKVTSSGGGRDAAMWFDGKTFTVDNHATGRHVSLAMPGSIDGMIQTLHAKRDFVVPVADLLYSDVFSSLNSVITEAQYRGIARMDGQSAHHIACMSGKVYWQIWVKSEGDPMPLRIIVDYPDGGSVRRYAVKITDLRAATGVTEDTFAFRAAPGSVVGELENVADSYVIQD